jgi:CRP-like cAMP-binding protein
MVAKVGRIRVMTSTAPLAAKADYRAVQNAILLNIPRKELNLVLSASEFVQLPARTVLNEIAKPIAFAYFLNGGVVSIINVMSDGKSVEVGLTGKEGFIGLPVIVGYSVSPTRAIVQIVASAIKISARDLTSVLGKCPKLENSLERYAQELAVQSIHISACNRLHDVAARLARWLLMSEDRVGESGFPLTQEFLSHMLGTRRASVTVAARSLQKQGLITYTRGLVTIENRAGLEKAACECYRAINQQVQSWRNGSR